MILKNNEIMLDSVAVALGAFDGIHMGHRKLIENVVEYASINGKKSCVFTFDVLPSGSKRIINEIQRNDILTKLGVDYLYVSEFNEEFKNTDADNFMEKYLKNVSFITVGTDFCFGKDRQGNVDTLKEYCRLNNIDLKVEQKILYNDSPVSSTRIRQCIKNADFANASEMLGYSYFIEGKVIHGNKVGRTIGFPTANVPVDHTMELPPEGVYITVTEFDGRCYQSFTNLGGKPTFNDNTVLLETHLFDFDGDLYGRSIKIHFKERIRDIVGFEGKQQLIKQLFEDKNKSLNFFSKNGLQM